MYVPADIDGAGASLAAIKQPMIVRSTSPWSAQAAPAGAQVLCLQELFYGPYFCAEQTTKLVRLRRACAGRAHGAAHGALAKQHGIAIIVPVYE